MASTTRSPLVIFTSDQLNVYTNNFGEENFIGSTQFGKLYRGKITCGLDQTRVQNVTVKIWKDTPWETPTVYVQASPADIRSKFSDELRFFGRPNIENHPNMVKLIGYCWDRGVYAMVYDLNPLDTLHNLILGGCFDWLQRIKVALGFARLLRCLHEFYYDIDCCIPYAVRNIDVAHIMIDKDFNPRLLDFGMLIGGCNGGIIICQCGDAECVQGLWPLKRDVYLYGVVVLSVISDRLVDKAFTKETVDEWAQIDVRPTKPTKPKKSFFCRQKICVESSYSLVHRSLEKDPNYDAYDGSKITGLALRCLESYPQRRPTMKEIVKVLQDLRAVQKYIEPWHNNDGEGEGEGKREGEGEGEGKGKGDGDGEGSICYQFQLGMTCLNSWFIGQGSNN